MSTLRTNAHIDLVRALVVPVAGLAERDVVVSWSQGTTMGSAMAYTMAYTMGGKAPPA